MIDRIALSDGGILDLDAIMTVMEQSFEPCYGEAWTAPQCAGLLPMPGVWLSLARDDDAVIGFALGRIIIDEAELMLLAVRRDAQGRGVGRMLLDQFVRTGTQRGARRLHLEVRAGNPAIFLYSKAGFGEVGRRFNYYRGRDGQLYDAVTLAKSTRG